jgi:hypothetical protein
MPSWEDLDPEKGIRTKPTPALAYALRKMIKMNGLMPRIISKLHFPVTGSATKHAY